MLRWHSEEEIVDEWGDEIDLEEVYEYEEDGDLILEATEMGHCQRCTTKSSKTL